MIYTNNLGPNIESRAFSAAQIAIHPTSGALQVDDSLNSLTEAIDFHVETVLALLRRLEPVTGEVVATATCTDITQKVPLAARIDRHMDSISNATKSVQAAIKALQI